MNQNGAESSGSAKMISNAEESGHNDGGGVGAPARGSSTKPLVRGLNLKKAASGAFRSTKQWSQKLNRQSSANVEQDQDGGGPPERLVSSMKSMRGIFAEDLASSFNSDSGAVSLDGGYTKKRERRGDGASAAAAPAPPAPPTVEAKREIGSRLKTAFQRMRQDSSQKKTAKLEMMRRESRRSRNSDSGETVAAARAAAREAAREAAKESVAGAVGGPMGYMQFRASGMLMKQKSAVSEEDSITTKLLEMTGKCNFCDIEIAGKDDVVVKAPSFLFACHSVVFEEIFYPRERDDDDDDDESHQAKKTTYSAILSPSQPRRVRIEFSTRSVIEAAVHFCATLELPSKLEDHLGDEDGDANIRTISRLHLLARLFKIRSLVDSSYRMARRILNKDPHLVCAALDECNVLLEHANTNHNWGLTMGTQNYDNLKEYTLEYMRESPVDTVLPPRQGAAFLSPASIEEIISDQNMDCDEYSMWRILNTWVKHGPGNEDDKIAHAKSLVGHIQLTLIDPSQLNFAIKTCGFVEPEKIAEALKDIKEMLENESPDDKERVIVEGAGDARVNGIYFLADEDIGLKTNEVMYLKEGDDEDGYAADFGLYRWGESWAISNATDYFNVLYTCSLARHKGHSLKRPPKWGWKCDGGAEPSPTCVWKPSKEVENMDFENMDASKLGIAPPLSKLKNEKADKLSGISTKSSSAAFSGHSLKTSFTLSQMMTLPEDADYLDGGFEYASGAKDLDAMMHLSVDEGHDDEEGGYDVNYMSATRLWDGSEPDLNSRGASESDLIDVQSKSLRVLNDDHRNTIN